jgi:hypothetical protein
MRVAGAEAAAEGEHQERGIFCLDLFALSVGDVMPGRLDGESEAQAFSRGSAEW